MAKTTEKQPPRPSAKPTPTVTYDVQEVIGKYQDREGKTQTMVRGWVIVQTPSEGKPLFCGSNFAWSPTPYVSIPFRDEEQARTQMKFHATSQAKREELREINSVVVEIPYCDIELAGNNATAVNIRMSPQLSQSVGKVQTALEQVKAETVDGTRVTTPTATIRWILEQLSADIA